MRSARHDVHCIRGAIDGYATGIVHLIGAAYGRDTVQHAWREFMSADETFHGHGPNAGLFFSWLFHQWSPTPEKGNTVIDHTLYGVPPTRAYLQRSSHRINPLLRQYLEACLATSPGFYEVVTNKPHVGFKLRDVLTGVECEVLEALASVSLGRGDILFAHLVSMDEMTLMDAISPLSLPATLKQRLIQLCSRRCLPEQVGPELRKVYFSLLGMH